MPWGCKELIGFVAVAAMLVLAGGQSAEGGTAVGTTGGTTGGTSGGTTGTILVKYLEFVPDEGTTFYPVRAGQVDTMPDDLFNKVGQYEESAFRKNLPLCLKKGGEFRIRWHDTASGVQHWEVTRITIKRASDEEILYEWEGDSGELDEGDLWPAENEDPIVVPEWVDHGEIEIEFTHDNATLGLGESYGSSDPVNPYDDVFIVLDSPNAPMSNPWFKVLEFACGAASEATDTSGSLKEITYDTYWGAEFNAGVSTYITGKSDSTENFKLRAFMNNNRTGGVADIADFLFCLATALGIDGVFPARCYPLSRAHGYGSESNATYEVFLGASSYAGPTFLTYGQTSLPYVQFLNGHYDSTMALDQDRAEYWGLDFWSGTVFPIAQGHDNVYLQLDSQDKRLLPSASRYIYGCLDASGLDPGDSGIWQLTVLTSVSVTTAN